ncbi:MAG: hypothetical protein OEY49_15380, partial [Candidatus Heimdallarchaeota archaeon]|nr:hypothetical protein [Candidatus Heimdallarchaeota archaeon]
LENKVIYFDEMRNTDDSFLRINIYFEVVDQHFSSQYNAMGNPFYKINLFPHRYSTNQEYQEIKFNHTMYSLIPIDSDAARITPRIIIQHDRLMNSSAIMHFVFEIVRNTQDPDIYADDTKAIVDLFPNQLQIERSMYLRYIGTHYLLLPVSFNQNNFNGEDRIYGELELEVSFSTINDEIIFGLANGFNEETIVIDQESKSIIISLQLDQLVEIETLYQGPQNTYSIDTSHLYIEKQNIRNKPIIPKPSLAIMVGVTLMILSLIIVTYLNKIMYKTTKFGV